jgi:transcriptional regulator with XRE-family HTH domain
MEIGKGIKELMKSKKMSQKDLCIKTNISPKLLSDIIDNNRLPKKLTIRRICKALDVPTAYLLLASLVEEDIDVEKREAFNLLHEDLKGLMQSEE